MTIQSSGSEEPRSPDADAGSSGGHRGPLLGFACAWTADRTETWSGTPFRLRAALSQAGPIVDVGVELPRPFTIGLKAAYTRRVRGHWVTTWRHREPTRTLMARHLRAAVRSSACDAVVMIQDLAPLPAPYLVVQDLSYDVLLDNLGPDGVPHFLGLTHRDLLRLRDRQLDIYSEAAALLPMSHWLGEQLVASGVPQSKVIPVHPAVNVPVAMDAPVPARRQGPQRRLLLIGRDPHTKGADLVIKALAVLRRDLGSDVTLTLAGPPTWPWEFEVPEGVDFRGPVSRAEVAALMDSHDLFVMPSRLEGFGIAFVEALSRGLPCIGRNAFAMPEIIQPGVGGALVSSDDPAALAATIADALADDGLYHACADQAHQVRRYYTWERAATEIRSATVRALTG